MTRTWRDHALAGFALVHIALVLAVALGQTRLDDGLLGAPGRAWNAVQPRIERLAWTYGSLLGPKQHWAMFSSNGTRSALVHVAVQTPDGTHLVFRERSDEAGWNRRAFDHYRWREMMTVISSSRSPDLHLQRFVDWVGPQLAAEHPEACRVIATVRLADALRPEALQAGEPHVFAEVRRRAVHVVPGRPCR